MVRGLDHRVLLHLQAARRRVLAVRLQARAALLAQVVIKRLAIKYPSIQALLRHGGRLIGLASLSQLLLQEVNWCVIKVLLMKLSGGPALFPVAMLRGAFIVTAL